jgi:hypothetical protein
MESKEAYDIILKEPSELKETFELLTHIIEYQSSSIISAITKNKVNITCIATHNNTVNASVQTTDFKNYTIMLNTGILDSLVYVIMNLENCDDIYEEIEQIALEIFNKKHTDITKEIFLTLIYFAIYFILSHEFAHIFRGHFKYMIKENIKSSNYTYNINEITEDKPIGIKMFDGNFIKLSEIDADVSAIDICLQSSVELFSKFSDYFFELYQDWNKIDETPKLRNACNKLVYYSASLAIALIEASRNDNSDYPMPLTRFLNISDAYRQIFYEINNIHKREHAGSITNININKAQEKLQEEYILIPFLSAMDIIVETLILFNSDKTARFTQKDELSESLYSDFFNLMHNLEYENLKTDEGEEYKLTIKYRKSFYALSNKFINI